MSQNSTASDIWSVGCTVIELLTGNPPYYDLGTFSALYRMADDIHPPIPEGLSSEMISFLKHCFVREPSERPTAKMLQRHEFIIMVDLFFFCLLIFSSSMTAQKRRISR